MQCDILCRLCHCHRKKKGSGLLRASTPRHIPDLRIEPRPYPLNRINEVSLSGDSSPLADFEAFRILFVAIPMSYQVNYANHAAISRSADNVSSDMFNHLQVKRAEICGIEFELIQNHRGLWGTSSA